jgi:hypothetical protein
MATSATARPWQSTVSAVVAAAAFALGACALAGEAAVHIQQYTSLVHGVRWIGPLFLANAVACIAAIAALAYPTTRQLAALAGVVISAFALAGLIVSYGREGGLFGWPEGGFRTAIVFAVSTELAAVVLLSTALAATAGLVQARRDRTRSAHGEQHAREDEHSRHRQLPRLRGEPTFIDLPQPGLR